MGRLSAVDLLALISLDKLLFILKMLFTLLLIQVTLMRLPPQLVFPALGLLANIRQTHMLCPQYKRQHINQSKVPNYDKRQDNTQSNFYMDLY
jgi:hypothetical protein